jgi:soluble lytic murein transglycosylase
MFRSLLLVILVGALIASPTFAAERSAAVREEFRAAYGAALQSTPAPSAADSAALRAYVLYPYVQAARIEQQLNATAVSPDVDLQAAGFLAEHDNEPIAVRLRRAWLTSLAKRERWFDFIANYDASTATSTLRCQYLTAHIATDQTDTLAPQIVERWLTPQQLPEACEPVFRWARERQIVTADLIEQRVRRVLEEGNFQFARLLIAQLPASRAAPLRHWADLLDQPRAAIDRLIAQPQTPVEPQALRAGWTRLARTNVDAAVERYERLIVARKLDATAASQLALPVALSLAWNRRSEALDYFERVQPAHLDDYALEWYARAALWNDDWPRVRQAIAAMSPGQREQAAWQYWLGRAAEQLGERELATTYYEAVIPTDNFYAAMAAARLGRKITPHQESLPLDKDEVARIESLPAFLRARELKLLGLDSEARAEWRYGYHTLTPASKRQAIHVAARWGWFDQAIATASDNEVFFDYELLYPLPYDDEVKAAAKLAGVDADIVYSVLRQESLYRADAVSGAGARGLLQLMPSTARQAAKKWNLRTPSERDLFVPAVNVRLGAVHLRDLLDRFDDQLAVALAGYNAGPNAAARWLPAKPIDADRWIENIPYNETRAYVRRVLWHSIVFGWLRKQRPQDASDWLVQVSAVGAKTRVAERD